MLDDWSKFAKEMHKTAREKGWWDEPRCFGDCIALIHSEISEALEAWRDGEVGLSFVNTPPYLSEVRKPEGVAVELVDALIRIADLCAAFKIDLNPALEAKIAYNRTRPYRHGRKHLSSENCGTMSSSQANQTPEAQKNDA